MSADACRFSPNTDPTPIWCVTPPVLSSKAVRFDFGCFQTAILFELAFSSRISTKTCPRPIRASNSSAAQEKAHAAAEAPRAHRAGLRLQRGPCPGWRELSKQQQPLRQLGRKSFEEVGMRTVFDAVGL